MNTLIKALAGVQTTVLITGESGTGKELVAEALHLSGDRSRKPLVNCDLQQPRAQLIKCLEPNRRVEIEVRGLN